VLGDFSWTFILSAPVDGCEPDYWGCFFCVWLNGFDKLFHVGHAKQEIQWYFWRKPSAGKGEDPVTRLPRAEAWKSLS